MPWSGVKSLVGATTKDGATPLYYACKNGFLECARVLLEFGGSTRGTDSGGNPNPSPDPNPDPRHRLRRRHAALEPYP